MKLSHKISRVVIGWIENIARFQVAHIGKNRRDMMLLQLCRQITNLTAAVSVHSPIDFQPNRFFRVISGREIRRLRRQPELPRHPHQRSSEQYKNEFGQF